MSESEEESEVCFYGTSLEPYDEDAFPKRRPITVEEQVAKDAQGRRRFHGAFTGGFSAGFFNTVGSLEGWMPKEFRSSRSEKAQNQLQKPEDFMDDEDVGEFGIAPQTVKATGDYATNKKRRKQVFTGGPIPGEPVLETLLQAGNETVGYFLMKNMNRKHRAEDKAGPKVYGCTMPKDLPEDEPADHPEYPLHELYKQYLVAPKSDSFGLGYVGLDKTHASRLQPATLTVRERNNKKLSIAGQAFGVGAFEDEDEDIYTKDDMSRYDFELSTEPPNKNRKASAETKGPVLDIFILSQRAVVLKNEFPPPVIPSSFSGKHNVKKSRFEPLPEEAEATNRKDINAAVRARYLGEKHDETNYTPSSQQHQQSSAKAAEAKSNKSQKPVGSDVSDKASKDSQSPSLLTLLSSSGLIFDRFVSAKQEDDPTNMLEEVKPAEITHGTKEMHAAVKLKMFGPLTRVTMDWQPCLLLCKRFNVPEPHSDVSNAQKNKKRTKNLIFEYQKHAESESLLKPGLSLQTTDSPADTSAQEPQSLAATSSASEATPSQPAQEPEKSDAADGKVQDLTERVDVSKNMDLFRAIFLSSSESESDGEAAEEDEEKRRKELIAASVVSEPLVPKIKPTKEGILSNIDFSKFRSSQMGCEDKQMKVKHDDDKQKEECEPATKDMAPENDMYGPRLPSKITSVSSMFVSETASAAYSGEWVEKGCVEKQKRHKKKHKKEKDRDRHRKKHKHKSKK